MINQRLNEGRWIGFRNQVLPMVEKEGKGVIITTTRCYNRGIQIIQLEGESNSIL